MQAFLAFLILGVTLIVMALMLRGKDVFAHKTSPWWNLKLVLGIIFIMPIALWVIKKKHGYAACVPAFAIAALALTGIGILFANRFDWQSFLLFATAFVLWLGINLDIGSGLDVPHI